MVVGDYHCRINRSINEGLLLFTHCLMPCQNGLAWNDNLIRTKSAVKLCRRNYSQTEARAMKLPQCLINAVPLTALAYVLIIGTPTRCKGSLN